MKKIASILSVAALSLAACSTPPPDTVPMTDTTDPLRLVENPQPGRYGQIVNVHRPMTEDRARVQVNRAIVTDECVYGYTGETFDTLGENHSLLTVDLVAQVVDGAQMILDQPVIEYGGHLDRAFATRDCAPADGAISVADPVGREETRVTATYVVHNEVTAYIIGGHRFEVEHG